MALPDTFTGTNGTALSTYDALWVRNSAYSGTLEIQSNTCRLRTSGAASTVYVYDQAPASADYDVSAVFNFSSNSDNAAGVVGRASKTANTMYMFRAEGANVNLYKFVAGVATQLGSSVASGVGINTNTTLKLSMVGTTIKGFVDGVEKISVTDSAIATAGFAGLRFIASATLVSADSFDFVVSGAGAQNLTQASRFDNTNSFYASVVSAGAVTVSPGLFSNTQSFYTPTVSRGTITLAPGLHSSTQTFYGATVTPGVVSLSATRLDNAQAFFGPTISQGGINLLPSRFDNAQTFYGPVVAAGSVGLTPPRLNNAATFYAASVSATYGLSQASRFDNAGAIYAPIVVIGGATLQPPLLASTNTFYAVRVTNAGAIRPIDPSYSTIAIDPAYQVASIDSGYNVLSIDPNYWPN
jgi:adhesin HecA-like repeat protein